MAMPVGTKRAAGQAAAWGFVAITSAISFIYFGQITTLSRTLLGKPIAESPQLARARLPEQTATRSRAELGRSVVLQAGAFGHYLADAEINGRRVSVLVDTGASQVALSFEDASQAGIYMRDSDFTQLVRTANGVARVAPIVLDRVSIGDITVRNVPASVSERGALGTTLLGMSFLRRLGRVDMRGSTLVLHE
jgi:aspartyl protease family protein